ncbi:MAG: hypothetical protein ACYDHY_17025 [Acidiferrobacterales bacterium]
MNSKEATLGTESELDRIRAERESKLALCGSWIRQERNLIVTEGDNRIRAERESKLPRSGNRRLRLALANARPTYGMTADERLNYVETVMATITGRSGDKDLGQP